MPLYAYGLLAGAVLVVVIWFGFVAPAERQMHERRMELMKRRLKQNEQRISQMKTGEQSGTSEADDSD